jgi:hypothetical protein
MVAALHNTVAALLQARTYRTMERGDRFALDWSPTYLSCGEQVTPWGT